MTVGMAFLLLATAGTLAGGLLVYAAVYAMAAASEAGLKRSARTARMPGVGVIWERARRRTHPPR